MAWRFLIAGLTLALAASFLSSRCSVEAATSENDGSFNEDAIDRPDVISAIDDALTKTGPKLSCCEYRSAEKKPYVIVSTLDGRITAIDASATGGQLVWSLQTDTEPLLTSSLSNTPFYFEGREFRLIPSMDGHFYMYNDAAVQSVPFNVDALLSGSLRLGADVLAGGKQIRTYFIDYVSGRLHQTCGASGCEHLGDTSAQSIFHKLIVKRTTQTVRGVDPATGAERWNLTVGEHELLLDDKEDMADDGPCICVNDGEKYMYGSKQNTQPIRSSSKSDWSSNDLGNVELKLVPPEGVLLAYDKNDPSTLLWEKKLESPVVQIWTLLTDGRLVERTIFDQSLVPAFSYYSPSDGQSASVEVTGRFGSQQTERMIYIGTYNDQKYVVRSLEERRKIKDLRADARDQSRVYLIAPAQLQLEDQSHADEYCGNDCPTCASDEVNGLILHDQYPRDMGWYLYKHRTPRHHRLESLAQSSESASKRARAQRHVVEFLGELPFGYFCFIFLLTLSAIVVPAALVARLYGQQLRELREVTGKWLKVKEEKAVEPSSRATSPVTETTHLTPTTPSQESISPLSESCDLSGRSYGRYNADFEPIRQLGKGGFGIVMESRNKHDDHLYAVKRIAFALTRSAKERVRREVKALAQLEHPGIVRYFSAWFEEPPADWQEKVDQEMFQRCQMAADDELNLESVSTKPAPRSQKVGDDTESLAPEIGAFGDGKESELHPEDQPSTFGTWTEDGQISVSHGKASDRDESGDAFEQKPLKWTPAPKFQQESVEIIFAHSTTADSPSMSSHSVALDRRKRQSSSSKQSSTKSEEGQSGRDENANTNAEQKPAGTAYLYIQMQLCRGTLKDWLLANNRSEDRDTSLMVDWFDQMVCAVQYVHDLRLVHRDLKPSNIFFSATGLLKIGDFGLATTTLPSTLPSDVFHDQPMAGDTNFLTLSGETVSPIGGTTDRVGTQLYMSPEQEAGRKCTSKADIYALGLIFLELLIPFKTLMERVRVIQDARRDVFPAEFENDCSQEYELVRRLLSRDPESRPTCLEIRQSDSFKPCLAIRPLLNTNDHYQPGRTVSCDSGRHSGVSMDAP